MRATVFGLDVESDALPPYLQGAGAPPTGRRLAASFELLGPPWPKDATLICDERRPDDSVVFQIEEHPSAGYLIHGPDYGSHTLSRDGQTLLTATEGLPDQGWQRLLVAQVLPFAALLRGLEVFHASGVVLGGEAIALLGPSNSGKTSLATQLCELGASFLADDVLTLEVADGRLRAHPGAPVAGVNRDAAEPSGEVLASDDREHIIRIQSASQPAPLGALFFIDRREEGPSEPEFEPAADAQMLLAATFNFVLATPDRLQGLLEVCALAAELTVERIVIGPGCRAPAVAQAIQRRRGSPA